MGTKVGNKSIDLDVGFYDPLSIFQGGFRTDFEEHIRIPSFYWKDNSDNLRVLKNVMFNFIEEIPHTESKDVKFLKFLFITCQTVEDYRSRIRPLILQWLGSMKKEQPKIPYFIFFFENTELRTAADKYLKTNIFHKLKSDFDNREFTQENIFKIKSIYSNIDEKKEVWKIISSSTSSLLANSINRQLKYFENSPLKCASIFEHLHQQEDAMVLYSELFNAFPSIPKAEFLSVGVSEILEMVDVNGDNDPKETSSSFHKKMCYYKRLKNVLQTEQPTKMGYLKNMKLLAESLLSFLNSLEICYKRNEIAFAMIEMFLSSSYLKETLQLHTENSETIITSIGKLLHLQRNELIALGTSQGYSLRGSLSIIDIQFENEDYVVESEEIQKIMKTQKTFSDYVIEKTRELIANYNDYGVNLNTIATLSTELALILFYSTDDYETSCNQLLKSFDYFSSTGWEFIGTSLLEVYIENLNKLVEQRGECVVSQLLASYITLAERDPTKIDDGKFRKLCDELATLERMETNNIFTVESLSSVYCSEVDVYQIDLLMKSELCSTVDKIKLEMVDDVGNTVVFTYTKKLHLKRKNPITLRCADLVFGRFEAKKLSVFSNKLVLVQNVCAAVGITPIETFYCMKNESSKANTTAKMEVSKTRYLNKDLLVFEVKVGSNDVSDIEMVFVKTDPDKLSKEEDYSMKCIQNGITSCVEFEVIEDTKKLLFRPSKSHKWQTEDTLCVEIPYYFPPYVVNTMLELSYELKFKSHPPEGETLLCSRKHKSVVESLLPIAVAADEFFGTSDEHSGQDFFLLSHYTVNAISVDNPIRIQDTSLISDNELITGWKSPKDTVAFLEQGSTFFFKIKDFNDKSVLLKIKYNCILEEIIGIMKLTFLNFITKMEMVGPVDVFCFSNAASKIWPCLNYKVNFFAITNRIIITNFHEAKLKDCYNFIDKKKIGTFSEAVLDFIESIKDLEIDEKMRNDVYSSTACELHIPVDLPPLNMMNTVKYEFKRELQYLVCEPINVKVVIDVHIVNLTKNQIEEFDKTEKKVRFCGNEESVSYGFHGNSASLEMAFTGNDQKWVISGLKNIAFFVDLKEASETGSHHEFDLTFIPLKPGKLQLPNIEIKNNNQYLNMEVAYRNTSESVLIVSELNKIIHSF